MTALLENLEALYQNYRNLEGAKPPHNLFHRGWSPPCPHFSAAPGLGALLLTYISCLKTLSVEIGHRTVPSAVALKVPFVPRLGNILFVTKLPYH